MRWQRWARFGVAAVGLSCAAALYVTARDREKPAGSTVLIKPDKDAILQSGKGRFARKGPTGEDRAWIDYESISSYADGRTRFTVGRITTLDDKPLDISADVIEMKGKSVQADNPSDIAFTGHVTVKTHDGLTLTTDAATYNDNTSVVDMPGAVHVERGRMTGDGVGGRYDKNTDVLTVQDKSHMVVAPDTTGAGALDATSRRMTLARAEKYTRLEDGARIIRDGDTLAGQTAMLYTTDDQQELRLIELRQDASVAPGSGAGTHPPAMRADDIDLGLHPGGRVFSRAKLVAHKGTSSLVMTSGTASRAITAPNIELELAPDGQTLTRLAASEKVTVELPAAGETPARTIKGDVLSATGQAPDGLKSARFDRNVEFNQTRVGGSPNDMRAIRSGVLTLELNGQLDSIKAANFSRDVHVTTADASAAAELARYDAAKNLMTLTKPEGRNPKRPSADNKDISVDGDTIVIELEKNEFHASGSVTTRSKPKTDAAGKPSALFDQSKEIFGWANEFDYRATQAKYTGTAAKPAGLKQGQNDVSGETVTLFTDSNNLSAVRHVETHVLVETKAGSAAAKPAVPRAYFLTGDTLDYQDAARTTIIKGALAKMTTPEGASTEGERIDLFLGADGRSLERFIVAGKVYVELEGQRRASGGRLVYDAATDKYTLSGSTGAPALLLAPMTSDPACTLSQGATITFSKAGESPEGVNITVNESCTMSIRIR
jgi:lipopolysaccharide export system protein LptA